MLNLSNLISLLEPRGVTAEVSKSTGISTGNMADWKKGRSKPTAEALVLISDYFNVSIDFLLGRSDIREYKEKKKPVQEISPNGLKMLQYFEDLSHDDQIMLIGEARGLRLAASKEEAHTGT